MPRRHMVRPPKCTALAIATGTPTILPIPKIVRQMACQVREKAAGESRSHSAQYNSREPGQTFKN